MLDDDVCAVVKVESFVEAVETKNYMQHLHNDLKGEGSDAIFYLRKATRAEYRRFERETDNG
jgi:hypothetical protein